MDSRRAGLFRCQEKKGPEQFIPAIAAGGAILAMDEDEDEDEDVFRPSFKR
jgi:hypothetical protein